MLGRSERTSVSVAIVRRRHRHRFDLFADELEDLVRAVQSLFTHAGRFAAFYTECQVDGDPIDILEAEQTRLGSAFMTAFEAEGIAAIAHSRIGEAEYWLERIRNGRMKRYLYVARPRT